MILVLALFACAPELAAPLGHRAVLEGVEVELSTGGVLHAAQATVEDGGVVRATEVRGSLPARQAEAPPLEIDAPRSEWDLKKRAIHFKGGVTAVRGEVTLTCQTLDVVMKDEDHVETATARGEVVVTRGERVATGEVAVLQVETGEVRLTGSPQLSEGPNRMTGTAITLYFDDERVVCDACRLVVAGSAVQPRPGAP